MGSNFARGKMPTANDVGAASDAIVRNAGRALFHPSNDQRPLEQQMIQPDSPGPAPVIPTPKPPENFWTAYGRYAAAKK